MKILPSLGVLTILVGNVAAVADDARLKSRAEQSRFEETSRYDDVIAFANELERTSPFVRLSTFGKTEEGRALPLWILADPPVSQPREAKATGKTIVFVMANIHGGEVEGKESVQEVARRILGGDLRSILNDVIVLIAPNYNADGNEKISLENRTAQYGPIGGVGKRENAKGLDLNRDYMKLESPEARALVGLMNEWDPHLTVDLHTTNGSYHGYHLTYSVPLNPTTDARIAGYHRDTIMPAIAEKMRTQHQFRAYYYGNFSGAAPKAGEPDKRIWRAFIPQPRVGQNYVGLRNRLTILSEAYSYLSFERRIAVTTAFVEEILKFAATHGAEIAALTQRADAATTRLGLDGPALQVSVESEMRPLAEPVEILVGAVKKVRNPRSDREMTVMLEDDVTPVKMLDYGTFVATRSVTAPRAYLFPPEAGLRVVSDKLRAHGVSVEELVSPLETEVERFTIEQVKPTGQPFQGHRLVRASGQTRTETLTFPAGTIVVRTAQPLGRLAAYLLEPESDDGFVTWNFLDSYVAPGKTYPISKLMKNAGINARVLSRAE
jgi:hypothetical protein